MVVRLANSWLRQLFCIFFPFVSVVVRLLITTVTKATCIAEFYSHLLQAEWVWRQLFCSLSQLLLISSSVFVLLAVLEIYCQSEVFLSCRQHPMCWCVGCQNNLFPPTSGVDYCGGGRGVATGVESISRDSGLLRRLCQWQKTDYCVFTLSMASSVDGCCRLSE